MRAIALPVPDLAAAGTLPDAAVAVDNIVVPWLTRTALTVGLQHPDALVRTTVLQVLATALHKLGTVLDALAPLTAVAPPAAVAALRQQIRTEVRRRLPDIQVVLALHAQLRTAVDAGLLAPQQSRLYYQVVGLLADIQRLLPEVRARWHQPTER